LARPRLSQSVEKTCKGGTEITVKRGNVINEFSQKRRKLSDEMNGMFSRGCGVEKIFQFKRKASRCPS